MKKIALLLALIMLCAFCVEGFAEDGGLSEPGVLPIWTGSEPAVIRVLTPDNAKVVWEDNEYTKWIEESCNVKLEFEFLPVENPKDKLSAMAASGELENFDVINIQLSLTECSTLDTKFGVLRDVSDFFEEGLAVNCDAAVAAHPEQYLISSITTAEGKIYGVPKIQIAPQNETKYKLWINQGWLDNLGLELPTTTDEFYDMLVAFKEQDANGNGDPNDEIPFITSTGFGGTANKFLTNAFVFEGDGDLFMLDEDGHVTVSYLQDGWFEACDYLKKLCDEGLLSPESFTYNNDALKAVACADEDIVGVVTNSSCAFMGQSDTYPRLRYVPIAPLTGPEGVCFSAYAASSTTTCWMVTPWAKNPELCFRVGDFQFTEEGYLRGRYGIEPDNWMYVEDYLAQYPGVELKLLIAGDHEMKYVMWNDIRDQTVNNLYWYEHMPYYAGDVDFENCYVADDGQGKVTNWDNNGTVRQNTITGYYQAVKPGMDIYVPNLAYSAEELEVLGKYQADLRKYVKEQQTKYIIGDESALSDPEAFKAYLYDTLGLQELLDIADAAYQRQYGK
ncbi:MAG: extracellular solute-binding protein [Clostridia bacterium]|jgi:ABC-type sugar transport system, periplasmic component|nr:extracellular solute-binding protein [Clostridia bacterium]MBQ9407870.1 extracellular solute-binding protein [Clostridia bacterium]